MKEPMRFRTVQQKGTHLLASTAAAPHVQLCTAADHGHSVVVAALPRLGISLHLDVVDVLVAVRLLPQLLDNLVDVGHLGGVEGQQRLLQCLQVDKRRILE